MLKVTIPVHPHEIESALDRLQYWSVKFDWAPTGPDITVELTVIPDHNGHNQQFDGDRFEMPHASAEQIAAQGPAPVVSLHPNTESTELMDFLRGGNQRA
jgi:hypothetical protein